MWCHLARASVVSLFVFGVAACAPAAAPPDSANLIEDNTATGEGVTGNLPVGAQLKATNNVNLRSSPSTSGKVLHVVAAGSLVTVQSASPSNGFYKVSHNGIAGWSYGKYYELVGSPPGGLGTGTILTATGDVNLRNGPGTSYSILDVVTAGSEVTLVDPTAKNGYYNVNFNGTVGWSAAAYYSPSGGDPGTGGSGGGGGSAGSAGSGGSAGSAGSGGSGGSSGGGATGGSGGSSGSGATGGGGSSGAGGSGGGSSSVITQAMSRAEAGVGFSYWWGHGRFLPQGPGGSAGSCSGSCPSCSHSGSYGGDCSGFVAKVWQVPSSNNDLSSDSHPYSTADFDNDTSQWSTVSRSNLKQADALVYRSGTSGHVFIYSSGDGWGSIYAYECKGCAAGCVKGYRTASSAYHGIRRDGF